MKRICEILVVGGSGIDNGNRGGGKEVDGGGGDGEIEGGRVVEYGWLKVYGGV